MQRCFILIAAFACNAFGALPEIPRDAEGAQAQKDMRMAVIESLRRDPAADTFDSLGKMVRQLADSSYRGTPEKSEFLQEARQFMLSIPGHAEYFANRIKSRQRILEDCLKGPSTDAIGTAQSKLLDEQMYGFATLKAMPSPETVRVLGEFLYDPWGLRPNLQPGEYPDLDEEGITSHSSRALTALAALPLAHKPVQPRPNRWVDYHQDIDAWKLWYEQVRAGTRTFRFIGDPQEYNLQGPVAAAIEPTPARPPRPTDVVPPTPVEVSPQSARRNTTIALSIALLLLVAAAWRAFRSQRKGARSLR